MRTYVYLFLVNILISSSVSQPCGSNKPNHRPPVLLVPGFGGSQIEAHADYKKDIFKECPDIISQDEFTVWANTDLIRGYADCWKKMAMLKYDRQTHTTRSMEGVHTRPKDFGNTTGVEYLTPDELSLSSYMSDLIQNVFLPLGYKRGVDLRAAPFDFRRAPNELKDFFEKLLELIEEMYHQAGQKVLILSHSMGSNIMQYFLNHQSQEWKDRHIETLVSVAGAWGGSVNAVQAFTSGYDFGLMLIDTSMIQEAMKSFPGLTYLLPSEKLWGPEDVLVESTDAKFTTANYEELFKAVKLEDAYEMYLDTKDLNDINMAPGVPIHCIVGTDVSTPKKYVFEGNDLRKGVFHVIYEDGDGTVNRRSLDVCLKWKGRQQQEITYKSLKGKSHFEMIKSVELIDYMKNLLKTIMKANESSGMDLMELAELDKQKEIQLKAILDGLLLGQF